MAVFFLLSVTACTAPEPRPAPAATSAEKPAPKPSPAEPPTVERSEAPQHPGVSAPATRPANGRDSAPPTPPKPATRPASQPASRSVDSPPELPPYIVRTIPIDPKQPLRVVARTREPSSLLIETVNLRRVRITRAGLPLPNTRSIAILIDGQGIEWTTKSQIIELEQSPAGAWQVISRE